MNFDESRFKNIEPLDFYRIFTESTRKNTFSTDDFATHKKYI